MAEGFERTYDGIAEAVQDWLDEQYGKDELTAAWFTKEAPVWQAPVRDDQVWVTGAEFPGSRDDNDEAIHYVFRNPTLGR